MGASSSSSPPPGPSHTHGIQHVPDRIRRSRRKQSRQNLDTMSPGQGQSGRRSVEMCSVTDSGTDCPDSGNNSSSSSSSSSGSSTSDGGNGGDGDRDWLNFDDYPFENLVFSGGGTKGYSYVGAVQAMDDCGIIPRIKRMGGTSIGAVLSSLMAVGCSAQETANFMAGRDDYIDWVFKDQSMRTCFAVPNLWRKYGINAGRRFNKLLGEVFHKKIGSADITFKQLYERTGKELCISVTNLNRMCSEYCNWHTTPDLPVRIAVRMSSSVPVMMAPVKYNINSQGSFYYCDGSLLDHYPIHCFDDNDKPIQFDVCSQKIRNESSFNEKTLGFFLVCEDTADYNMWRALFHVDMPYAPTYIPQSKLAKYRLDAEYKKRKKKNPEYTRKQMDAELRDHSTGEWLHYDLMDRHSADVTNAGDVLLRSLQAMFALQRQIYSKPGDVDRTVPINCGYVQTVDTVIEAADKEFLIKQGYAHTMMFLKEYVVKAKAKVKRKLLETPRNPSAIDIDDLQFMDECEEEQDPEEDSGVYWELGSDC